MDDYTGYSGDPALQEGNYIVLHASADDDVTIKVKLLDGVDDEKTLDADGLVIARLTTNADSIRFRAIKGDKEQVRVLNLISLVLEEDE